MGLPCKTCRYGICFFILVAFSLTCGCICGLSPQEHHAGGNDDQSSGIDSPETGSVASVNMSESNGRASPTISPVPTSRPPDFTMSAEGGMDHRPGERVRFYGIDTCSDVVYLFVSCTGAPICGGSLDDPKVPIIDRDTATFTRVNVSEDGSWEYFWTAPADPPELMFDLYNVIASAEPRDKPHLDEVAGWAMVTVKIS
jgi:hypothetical protein